MGGFSLWHLLILLAVVVLLFGTKKLRNVGGDLGAAIKSFRKGLQDEDSAKQLEKDGDKPAEAVREPSREKSE